MEITSVLKEILIPYQGKVISLNCSNQLCGKPMKVNVPFFNKREAPKTVNHPETVPTQIVRQNRHEMGTAKIRVLKNDKTDEQVFELKEGNNKIGRYSLTDIKSVPDIPIFTQDKMISRNYHCEIIVHKKEKFIEAILRDTNSKNGTFLPGSEKRLNPVDEIFLKDKDVFIIGETKIKIELS